MANKKESKLKQFSETVGGYWSKSNSDFEKTNPSVAKRVARSLNPMTGFGSAVGAMYDSASKGDKVGMAIAAVSAIPAVGYARTVLPAKTLKAAGAPKKVSDIQKTVKGVAANTGVNVAADVYNPEERPPMSKKWVEK